MAIQNPAFSRNEAFAQNISTDQLNEMYERPAAGETMTVEDTVAKTTLGFIALIAGAAVGWATAAAFPVLWMIAGVLGFVLALVNIFKKEPSPALILTYSLVQGVVLGGISAMYESQYPGVVLQAVIGTVAVIGVTLALFASGKVRASAHATKVFLVAMLGYVAYSLINMFLVMFNVTDSGFGLSADVSLWGIPLGIVIGVFVVIMGAYSLVLDFDYVQRGVANGAHKKFGWSAAFGIIMTAIWLYLEILRMLAISRD